MFTLEQIKNIVIDIKSDDELSKYIISIEEANVKEGGEGAILIKLRNLQNKF